MKQVYILLALLFIGLSSCKDEEEISGGTYVPEGYSGLTLHVATADKTAGTKAAVGEKLTNVLTKAEKEIHSLAFFVSLPDGQPFQRFFSTDEPLSTNGFYEPLHEVGADAGDYTANIRVRGKNFGECEIFVIANYAENGLTDKLKAITKLSDLKNFKVSITDNAQNPLLMYNYQKQTLTEKQTKDVSFPMTRLVARIDIRNLAATAIPANGFVLESARLVNAKMEAFVTATHTADEINLLPVDDTKTFALHTPEAASANIDTLYTYENANTTPATATALELIGTFRGIRAVKHVDFRRVKPDGTTYETVAIERNKRYVVEISPDKDSTDVKLTIKVVDWNNADTIKVEPNKAAPEFKNLTGATFTKLGTDRYQTLDIKSADLGTPYTFNFDAYSYQEMKYELKLLGNKEGDPWVTVTEFELKSYADTDKRFSRHYDVAVTPYTGSEKIGTRRALLIVKNQVSGDNRDTIQILQRIDYVAAGLQAVLMKDGKFWAPVNVGATKMPTSVSATGDITSTCGQLFQWGRKQGFVANEGATYSFASTYPTESDLEGMEADERWMNKFVKSSSADPDTKGNWLLFQSGIDNPAEADMVDNATYQRLWDFNQVAGNESNKPQKASADPCPVGWRVPSIAEWKNVGASNDRVPKEWDEINKLVRIAGAIGSEKFVLPAVGNRGGTGGSSRQGASGYYWSSSVASRSSSAHFVNLNLSGNTLTASTSVRAVGLSVRCIQED